MQNLLRLFRSYLKYNLRDKYLILKVFILSFLTRILLLIIPFKYIKKHLGKVNVESEYSCEEWKINVCKRVRWAVNKVSRHTLWESKCLVQAMISQKILSSKNIKTTLYLGVGKEDGNMIAHAWIRCGNYYVTGGNGEGYGVVAKFTK